MFSLLQVPTDIGPNSGKEKRTRNARPTVVVKARMINRDDIDIGSSVSDDVGGVYEVLDVNSDDDDDTTYLVEGPNDIMSRKILKGAVVTHVRFCTSWNYN
jgi:hypothetical protein